MTATTMPRAADLCPDQVCELLQICLPDGRTVVIRAHVEVVNDDPAVFQPAPDLRAPTYSELVHALHALLPSLPVEGF